MSKKLDNKLLKELILEAIEEIRTDGRGAMISPEVADALARAGIAEQPESARRELIQIISALNLTEPEGIDMIKKLIDAAGANIKNRYGLEESHSKEQEEELKTIVDELKGASKMHASQAERIQKILDETDDDELKEEEQVSEGMNCGCGKDPCETFGQNGEKLTVYINEEMESFMEQALFYGLIEEDDTLEEKKKKKKGCKPSKGKKYARRVKGKCVSYGAKGYKIAPGTSKGNSYCARSYGDMKSHGKDCSGKDRGTPLCLSRKKWKCSGKYSRKGK